MGTMSASVHRVAVWVAIAFSAGFACSHHEPPAPAGSPSVAPPELDARSAPTAAAVNASAELAKAPAIDPARLPQTRDKPRASGPAFEARVAALCEATARGDPDRAMSFFFPLAAYEQVKDIANPAADWNRRLVAAYARDIRALHAKFAGANPTTAVVPGSEAQDAAGNASFLAIDVPEGKARWVEPGEEYNKIGYFRVFGSTLRCEVGGLTQTLEVKSLISWRGEWYVVHLSAIN